MKPAENVRSVLDSLTLLVLALVLLASPWPLGSRLPWAAIGLATGMLAVAGVWFCVSYATGRDLLHSPLYRPMAAFLGWAALQWLLGTTVYRHGTAVEWLKYASYAATVLITLYVARRRRRASWLLGAIVLATVTVGLFSLVQYYNWNGKLFWFYESPFGGTTPFGPFNNRNYFVGYMLAGLGPCFTLALAGGANRLGRVVVGLLASAGAFAIILSRSRGGALSLVGMLALVALLAIARPRQLANIRRWLRPRRLAVLLLFALAGLAWIGQSVRAQRGLAEVFLPRQRSAIGRIQIWSDSLPMILDAPLFGHGLNTYQWTNFRYRTIWDTSYPQHAHNEYLETTVETGLVGAAFCLWFLIVLMRTMWARLRDTEDRWEYAIRLSALASWSGLLAFSAIDFPTVIPATDYLLAVLAALGTMSFEPIDGPR